MAMPQEEIKKQQEQTASGGEGPGGDIPSSGWGFFMTYLLQRLDSIEDSINSRIDRLDGKIGAVESNLRGEMNSRLDSMETNLRGEIKQVDVKVEAVEANLNAQIGGLRQEMDTRLDGVNSRIDGLHQEIEAKLDGVNNQIGGLRQEMDTRLDGVNSRIDGLHQELHGTNRWAIGAVVAVIVGLGGVIVSLLAVLARLP